MANAVRMTIPLKKFRKHIKPYWTNSVKQIHNHMSTKRKVWIHEGQPIKSYREYKPAKLTFRRELFSANQKNMVDQLQEIDRCGDVNQELFWTLINRRRVLASNAQHELKLAEETICGTDKLFSDFDSDRYDKRFKDYKPRLNKC